MSTAALDTRTRCLADVEGVRVSNRPDAAPLEPVDRSPTLAARREPSSRGDGRPVG